MMRFLAGAAAAAALSFSAAPGRACTCPDTRISVIPGAADAAPINTHVWILIPTVWLDELKAEGSDLAVSLRPHARAAAAAAKKGKKGKKGASPSAPKVVDADLKEIDAGGHRIVELIPKQSLAAKTKYEVVMRVGSAGDEIVGELTTGDAADTEAPEFQGIQEARYVRWHHDATACGTGEWVVRLTTAKVEKGADLYGIWWAGEDGKVRYESSPAAYVWGSGANEILLGRWSSCLARNVILPKDAKRLTVGVRAIDWAGNKAETAGEAEIDLTKLDETRD